MWSVVPDGSCFVSHSTVALSHIVAVHMYDVRIDALFLYFVVYG